MRFRIRSSQRDSNSDASRIAAVEQSIRGAIAGAEAEKKGLGQRLSRYRTEASLAMGNSTYGNEDRDPEDEKLLSGIEAQMSEALARMKALDAHIEHLNGVLSLLLKAR